MRITCPNCQAQYDIDAAMIPPEGRDVQCSNCAHTWLELGDGAPKDAASAPVEDAPHNDADGTAVQPASDGEDAPAPTDATGSADAEKAGQDAPDPADRLRDAIDRPKVDRTDPKPEPDDFVSDLRETIAEPSSAADNVADDLEDAMDDTADDIIEAARAVTEDPAAEAVGAADETLETYDREEDGDLGEAGDIETPDHAPVEDEDITLASDALKEDTFDLKEAEDAAEHMAIEESAAASATATALDEEVADILREEAEREVTQRRSEDPPALEAQAELGLGEEAPSEVLRERLDRMRGDGVPQATVAQTLAAATATPLNGPRRERLPDIEEIKTTLRPGDLAPDDEPPIGPSEMNRIRQAGFRRGFATLVLAAGVLVAAYVFAPQIIDLIPGSEQVMMSYVDTANTVRDGIDRMMARAITGLNGLGNDA